MKLLETAKKSLGQNFLTDRNIINKIIAIGNVNKNKIVMEIGAGYGHLTNEILSKKAKKILAIEKDKKFSPIFEKKFINYHNIKIVNQDILSIVEENNFEKML